MALHDQKTYQELVNNLKKYHDLKMTFGFTKSGVLRIPEQDARITPGVAKMTLGSRDRNMYVDEKGDELVSQMTELAISMSMTGPAPREAPSPDRKMQRQHSFCRENGERSPRVDGHVLQGRGKSVVMSTVTNTTTTKDTNGKSSASVWFVMFATKRDTLKMTADQNRGLRTKALRRLKKITRSFSEKRGLI